MPRRSNKTKKASVKRRRFTRKQRGGASFLNGLLASAISAAKKLTEKKPVAASPAPKPVAAAASPAPTPVASVQTFDKNHPIIKLLGTVKEVVKNYITDKSLFCEKPSTLNKITNYFARRAPTALKFKTADKIFDGLLIFLYKNRNDLLEVVFNLKKKMVGVNLADNALKTTILGLSYVPSPLLTTTIKKFFFAEPGVINNIHASITTLITDPKFKNFCTTTPTSDETDALAKKLMKQIADNMKLPVVIKNALASDSW